MRTGNKRLQRRVIVAFAVSFGPLYGCTDITEPEVPFESEPVVLSAASTAGIDDLIQRVAPALGEGGEVTAWLIAVRDALNTPGEATLANTIRGAGEAVEAWAASATGGASDADLDVIQPQVLAGYQAGFQVFDDIPLGTNHTPVIRVHILFRQVVV